jgi:hypothetical protein
VTPAAGWCGAPLCHCVLCAICRKLLPSVGVGIKFPALEFKRGSAAGILPPSAFYSRFVDRTADCEGCVLPALTLMSSTQRPGSATKE